MNCNPLSLSAGVRRLRGVAQPLHTHAQADFGSTVAAGVAVVKNLNLRTLGLQRRESVPALSVTKTHSGKMLHACNVTQMHQMKSLRAYNTSPVMPHNYTKKVLRACYMQMWEQCS
jgi:hypothetical protein